VLDDPRALFAQATDATTRALCHLSLRVTEAPWTLGPPDLARARAGGLSDGAILQAVLLSAFFGHLNRVADGVGIDLDYRAARLPPPADPATPPYRRPAPSDWPSGLEDGAPRGFALSMRPGIAEVLQTWQEHALHRDAPLDRSQRALIARAVAERLGDHVDTGKVAARGSPLSTLDQALLLTADEVTLAPWRLGEATIQRLRAAGLADDAAIFDAIATAAGCTTFSRIRVALAALNSQRSPKP
jgi:alkylhydroperoxidase family enzyme